MAKTKEQKKVILENVIEKIEKSKSLVFAEFGALTVKQNEDLRQKLRKENSEYQVVKKTLLGLAFEPKKIENLNPKDFKGRVAVVFGYEDEVAPAKILNDFMKEKENEDKISFAGGILENKFLSSTEVEALAKIPSKPELYAKMVGSLNAPISGFVNVLAGNMRSFLNVLKAIEEKKA